MLKLFTLNYVKHYITDTLNYAKQKESAEQIGSNKKAEAKI